MASIIHAVWRPAAIGAWTGAFGRLRMPWPWAACLVALLLVAAPIEGHATLMEGSYNITGSCTDQECPGGPFSFSGMFDIDSSESVQNFMMSFDVPDPLIYTGFSLVTTSDDMMLSGRVRNSLGGFFQFNSDGSWFCSSGNCFLNDPPTFFIRNGLGGSFEIEPKQVDEPPTAALFAFGLILIVWLRRRAGSSAVRSARLVPGSRT